MSTFGDSQVRHLFVGDTDQTNGTVEAVVDGEIGAFDATGGATVAGEAFVVAGFQNGKKRVSQIINPKNVISAGEKTLISHTYQYRYRLYETVGTGDPFEIVLYMNNYGASKAQDAGTIRGVYVAQSGDNLVAVIDGLVASLNAALRKEGIPAFDGTYGITATNDLGGNPALMVEAGRGTFVLGKFDGSPFNMRVAFNSFDSAVYGIFQDVVRIPTNNGVEIANLEWFTEGNAGDIYRGSGYPNNFEAEYNANPSADYKIYEVVYYTERIGAPGDKQRQVLTVANSAAVTALAAAIAVALG